MLIHFDPKCSVLYSLVQEDAALERMMISAMKAQKPFIGMLFLSHPSSARTGYGRCGAAGGGGGGRAGGGGGGDGDGGGSHRSPAILAPMNEDNAQLDKSVSL